MLLSHLQESPVSRVTVPTLVAKKTYLPMEFCFNGMFHFGQNILAFILLSLVSPVTYSVASLIKRVVVITFSIIWFGSRTTPVQAVGIGLTFLGLYLYDRTSDASKADRRAKMEQLKLDPLLPISNGATFVKGGAITDTPLSATAMHLFKSDGFSGIDNKKVDATGPGRPRDAHPMPSGLKQEDTWTPQDRAIGNDLNRSPRNAEH